MTSPYTPLIQQQQATSVLLTVPATPSTSASSLDDMNAEATTPRAARRYAFACECCRRKKVKCDGELPSCRRCRRSHDTCIYAQRTTTARLEQATARIEQLEAELAPARHNVSAASTSPNTGASSAQLQLSSFNEAAGGEQQDISQCVGLDEDGHIAYHGPTSRFSDGGLTDWQAEHAPLQHPRQSSHTEHKTALQSNYNMLSEVWEPLLASKSEQDLGAEPRLVHRLLAFFWTWQYPLHNYLYKPCFIMDMALGGPYYTKFLLHCIMALSARHLDPESPDAEVARKGEAFLSTAKQLLIQELGATKPKIPTIQGLLILSGRQCAVGKTSEGWLYAGMAIRMMTDLGLHLNFQELMHMEKLTPIELEVRKRLYCSAYIWDKSLSLSLGRPPSLRRLPPAALDFFDHADDHCAWQPTEFSDYPSTMTYQTTCFAFFCRLSIVTELIMQPIPRGITAVALKERITLIEDKLHHWYDELPSPLKMASQCEICPPPHILSLNVLYHTLLIILWRPYLNLPDTAPHATAVCMSSAKAVQEMLITYGRTFELTKMAYLVSYCVYTAATVYVHEMKAASSETRQDAAKRLAALLQILESESRQTPGMRRSIDIIKRHLRLWNPAQNGQSKSQPALREAGNQANSQSIVSGNGEELLPTSAFDPSLSHVEQDWEYQNGQDNMNPWTSDDLMPDFGLDFLDTSAGFHLPLSFNGTPSFDVDTPFYDLHSAI